MIIYISIIIPCYNEAESLPRLYKELIRVITKINKNYEVIFVNDGSKDKTQLVLEDIYSKDQKHIRIIEFRDNFGKTAALKAGFGLATGQYIIQLDADLQDDPQEIPKFIEKLNEGFDVVVGWKQERKDSIVKNQSSKFFNWVTNAISKAKLHDHNCGFKAYKSDVAKELNIYGELHRYIGVIASSRGYSVTEVKITHRKRVFGKTKYDSLRFIHGFLDLLTVIFITRYRSRPLHLFGYLGIISFTIGFSMAAYLTGVKIFYHQSIGDRPLLLLAVMLMIMGVQISVTGLVGEQITTMIHKDTDEYVIKKVLK